MTGLGHRDGLGEALGIFLGHPTATFRGRFGGLRGRDIVHVHKHVEGHRKANHALLLRCFLGDEVTGVVGAPF